MDHLKSRYRKRGSRPVLVRLVKKGTATYRWEPGKHGPAKCTDIIAFDSNGLIYLIECKGTTTNSDYTTKQFNASAFHQKISVEFDNEVKVAQRLATGVYIAKHNSSEESRLRIADPPPQKWQEGSVCVVKATVSQMAQAIKADTIALGLLAAGFVLGARSLMPEYRPELESPTGGTRYVSSGRHRMAGAHRAI